MYERDDELQPERLADTSDRATVEELAFHDEALTQQRMRAAATMPKPTGDGTCACGCGEEVDPRRLALGLGLTIDCAHRRERAAAQRRH